MRKPVYDTTESALRQVVFPSQTRSYKPITHSQLIDLTLESAYKAGFIIKKETYTSTSDGLIANGRYTVGNVADKEMELMIGWQNSGNKLISLKFAIGAKIMICENGCVSGSYACFKKKHTGEVQTFAPDAISSYIKSAGEVFHSIQNEREQMKNIEVTKKVCGELLGRLFLEHEVISSVQLNTIKRELLHPTFDYGAPNSLWSLYQYTTFAMKGESPATWMRSHIEAHEFFTEAANIIQTAKPIEIVSANQLELELV